MFGKLIAEHRSILLVSLACAALCVDELTSSTEPVPPPVGDGPSGAELGVGLPSLPFTSLRGTGGGGIGSTGTAGVAGTGVGTPGRDDVGSPAFAFSTSLSSLPRAVINWGAMD